ncbi:MAG TPA: 2-oxoglutarate dehydrogenase E1 component [Bdellovibrionales bacterium]|nr:2-oxoglutarate dehydrogenase E1 component [Bdellovibrionales bacterium]
MSYLSQISPDYLEYLRDLYERDPQSLPASWRFFFDGMELGLGEAASSADTQVESKNGANGHAGTNGHAGAQALNGQAQTHAATRQAVNEEASIMAHELRVLQLIDAYRLRGHLVADLDPLKRPRTTGAPSLELSRYGLERVDQGQRFQAAHFLGLPPSTLAQMVDHLKRVYCNTTGVEFMHLSDFESRSWLAEQLEKSQNQVKFTADEQKQIFQHLVQADYFEAFLHKNYTGQKRFSLEGGESLIPAMQRSLRVLAAHGAKEIVIGMAHRGRLNVLCNVLGKSLDAIFTEFEGYYPTNGRSGGGDVKYHLGHSSDVTVDGMPLHLTLAFNPSHLEAVNPVVEGITRAKQDRKYGSDRNSIVPILIHGDAALIGQGVVAETLNFSNIPGYCTGGTVHIVINNQVGFTTGPDEARSGLYSTDWGKAIDAPIFHVNGNDPEAVVRAIDLASRFRMKYNRDVFVDIYCYRKYGHNEGDEPRFTQPAMYEKIGGIKNARQVYQDQLAATGILDEAGAQKVTQTFLSQMDERLQVVRKAPKSFAVDYLRGAWSGLTAPTEEQMLDQFKAPISKDHLEKVLTTIHKWPEGFQPLPKLAKMFETRWQNIQRDRKVDWAVGEQLAFGSLLLEGYSVRLSGQDAQRGTFSHRHAKLTDHVTEKTHFPLRTLEQKDSYFVVLNSPLSEFGVMGFDFGYSLAEPKTLVLWEAQFGDFANGAQVMIDQFISSSEMKWHRLSGLVLLLPHGYEGQGPEHSSARLERFLQLCAEGNMQVAYPTTPAQYAHLLRRQVVRNFRKPLVVMSPKSPLRMPEVVSHVDEFTNGHFQNLMITGAEPDRATRVILCTGKVYWDLVKYARERGFEHETAFVRVEQLYPLDRPQLADLKARFKRAHDWVWAQEEPQNMGAWTYIFTSTYELGLNLRYAGRRPSSSVATGSLKTHAKEQDSLIQAAFGVNL